MDPVTADSEKSAVLRIALGEACRGAAAPQTQATMRLRSIPVVLGVGAVVHDRLMAPDCPVALPPTQAEAGVGCR